MSGRTGDIQTALLRADKTMTDQDKQEQLEELFYQGSDLHGEGRHAEAMECFERCLAIDKDYTDALLGKAMVFSALEQHDQAIELAKRIIELCPNDPLAYTNLSMFYQRAGRIDEAEEAGAKARMSEWKEELGGSDD